MTDSLERFLEDLRFEVPAGLAHRAKAAAAQNHRAQRTGVNWQRQPWALTLVAALIALAIVATLILGSRSIHRKAVVPGGQIPTVLVPGDPIPPSLAANGWIAYSTDGPAPGGTDITTGSDIYVVRPGVAPRLIAGREGGKIRNVCPTFSADGRGLAYGVDAAAGRALVVLGVNASGAITGTDRFPVPGSGSTVCPRWSSDGKRVAYLEGGTVIVRGLDGSTPAGVVGDPGVKDFGPERQLIDHLLSPKGDRIATLDTNSCQLVIARPDGATVHRIQMPTCYTSPLMWSPDSRQILTREDDSWHSFTMRMIAVDSPFKTVPIVSGVVTNGARSWPHRGDISWQPVLLLGDPIPPAAAANGWIAYSTSSPEPRVTDTMTGSDIYVVRAGVKPRLIAGRDGGKTRNVCPAFSPDGRWLAYGVDSAAGRALVLLAVDPNGVITYALRFPVPGSGSTVCPRWSSDGMRIAYLDDGAVAVRGLDGSTPTAVAGDPRVKDFGIPLPGVAVDGARRLWTDPLLSPMGDRIARLTGGTCQVVVAWPDGSAAHAISPSIGPSCMYALPTWSPDGRQVLVMVDGGDSFTMEAIAVDSPFEMVTIVSNVQANGVRSMPGWGDVSWQPVLT